MPKTKILCVDDNPVNNRIVNEILCDEFDVKIVESGRECLDVIAEFNPELILLDVMMPEMDGYKVLFEIKNNPATSFIRVMFVSARSMLHERVRGYESGADGYLTKPFDSDELIAKVRSLLKLKTVQEVDYAKKSLAMLIAHEIRTPLNGIMGNAQYLVDTMDVNEVHRECLEDIVKSSEALLKFSDNSLLLTRLNNSDELELLPVNLNKLIKKISDKHNAKFPERMLGIENSIGPDETFSLNQNLFALCCELLFDNAVKYSKPQSIIHVVARKTETYLKIAVVDHGSGLSGEFYEQIFDMFSIKDVIHHTGGQGLSLAIVRKIIQLHGGFVRARETFGGGLTVEINLPLKEEHKKSAP